MQTLFAISSKMSIFNINFSARDNLRVAAGAGAGDEARPLERENVDIGAGWAGQRALAAGHGGQLTSSRRRSPGSRHGSGV